MTKSRAPPDILHRFNRSAGGEGLAEGFNCILPGRDRPLHNRGLAATMPVQRGVQRAADRAHVLGAAEMAYW